MKLLSPTNLQAASSEFTVPMIEQLDQPIGVHSTDSVNNLPETLFPSLAAYVCVAAVFFFIGIRIGKRQRRGYKPKGMRQQHIQTLERIWQMTANRKE